MQKKGLTLLRDRVLLGALALLCAYFLAELAYFYVLHKSFLTGLCAAALLALAAFLAGRGLLLLIRARECPIKDLALYALFAGITILPRLFLILTVKVQPQSDYALYYQSAASLAATGVFPVTDYTIAVAPNTLSFIGVLGGVMKLFGTSVLTAQLFNLALITGCVLFFFALARQMVSKNAAILATLLYALSPNSILFSLCVASEPLALLFFLGGLCLAASAYRKENLRAALALGFLSGAFLGFSSAVRANALAALVSVLLYGLLFLLKKRGGLAALLSIAAGFLLLSGVMEAIAWQVYQAKPGITFGWALYEGLDKVSAGGWTQENSDVLMSVMKQLPPQQVQGEMLRLALQRIQGYSLADWVSLIARKGLSIWVYSDYAYGAVFAAQDTAGSLISLSQFTAFINGWINGCHQALLAFFAVQGLACAFRGRRGRVRGDLMLACLPILGFVAIHSLVTSIPRYQYMAIPLFILSAVYFLERGQDKFPRGIAF